MIRFCYRLLFLLFIPFDLFAQSFMPNPDWRFENFNNQNHFVSREIPKLTMDKHGYVWVCSRGVQRFDGYRTIDFNSFDQAKGGIKDNYTDIIADDDGRIWISSGGLCYYDDASSKFIYVQTDIKHNIAEITAFFVQKNYLWFVCNYGLAKLDLRSLKISFTSLTGVTDPLCTYLIDENTLLISSREKVYTYNIKKDTYSANTLTYNHSLVKIFAVTKSGATIFLGTNSGLFALKNLKDISLVSAATKDVVVDDILFLPEDKEKRYLFLATDGKGIMVYNTLLKKIEFTYAHDDDNLYSLPNNIVLTLFADKKGRLWISTALGVSMLDVFNQRWKMRFLNKSNTDELYINKIALDKRNSAKVWMSSYNQGMILMNWKTKKIEKIFNTDPDMQKIYNFVQLSENKWLLVTQKKIMEWSPQSGVLSKKRLPVPDSLGLVYNIRRIIMADVKTCFITTNRGLFKYDLITHQINAASINNKSKKREDLLKYDLQNGFYENGILWIASRNGLFKYDIAKQATTVYRGKGGTPDYFFFDITKAVNDQIVCASGNGITIFNKKTKSFKVINTIANIFNPDCESVISINNMVWISAEVGILNYDMNTHKSERAEHETPLMQIFPASPFTIIGNDIVLGFRNGYAYFTPDQKNISLPSDPLIEGVYVNNQPVLLQYPTQSGTRELVFSHSDNSINIAFTAFLYTDPDHINFRYRLKGADSRWQYTDDRRSANYAQLPPGDYTFYVQCGNKNGIWNNHLASFNFLIQPPYWATWWFRTLVIVLIAFGLYRLYRYKINHILAIERIRERIASDFHDDIGSALSSISIFSEVADKQLKQQLPPEQTREIIGHISFHSRAMLDAMDDIIWAVNPQNDQFNDLAVRMREFAIPLLEARNIHFDIKIQEEILNTRIKMEARKNIFLIFKECINNILKHSGCTAIKVSVNKLNNQLELIISDNGKGFDINAPHTRNGLKNMQKRAGEINGTIQVTTQPGNGTVTTLLVNII
jgi:hypothetical protein